MKIGIVGLGLMGGSWALALRKTDSIDEIIGYDEDVSHRQKAVELGLVHSTSKDLDGLIERVDTIVLAIPVDAIENLLPNILHQLRENQFVIDFGSTKSTICKAVSGHPKRSQYLAAHPIAGTEYSGPEAAFESLYREKVMIVCDREMSQQKLVDQFLQHCDLLGTKVVFQDSEEHDLHLAYVSHLSHVTSFGLSNAVLKKEKEENQILALAGSGFESTVRLAKSSPEMWTPIFMKNREAILESVQAYLEEILKFKNHLKERDEKAIHRFLTEGRAIRKILK